MRPSARRLGLVMLVVCASALGAAGCGGSDDDGGGSTAAATVADPHALGETEITMWQHSYPPLNDWTREQIRAFEREYPNIDVRFELIPFEEYNQKILTALAGGSGPEVFESDDYTFAQFMQNSTLAPLQPAQLGADDLAGLEADYEANSLDLVTDGDQIYGLPYDWEAPVLTYNIRLLEQAGIDPSALTGDWTGLMEQAAKLSRHDGRNLTQSGFSFVHNTDVYYQLQGTTLFNQAGASVLNEDGTAAAIDSPEAARVFELWRDAVWKYRVTSPGFTSTFYTDEFGRGRVASGWMYVWANSILAPSGYENGRDFAIEQLPTFDGSPVPSASYAWNWVLNASAGEDELVAGQALLDYLSRQGASQLARAGLINPRKGWRDQISTRLAADFEAIFASLANSEPIEPTPQFNEIWKPIIALFKEVEHDPNVDIPARLREVAQEIDAVLGA